MHSAPGDSGVLCSVLCFQAILDCVAMLRNRVELKKTTELVKGTSLETIESQTQQDSKNKNLENHAKGRRSEAAPTGEQARALLEVMAGAAMAQAPTRSVLTIRAKVHRTDSDGFELVNIL